MRTLSVPKDFFPIFLSWIFFLLTSLSILKGGEISVEKGTISDRKIRDQKTKRDRHHRKKFLKRSAPLKEGVREFLTNLTSSELALRDDAEKINVYKFHYRSDENPDLNLPSGEQTGVMADEVETVWPDLVELHPSGFKQVNYGGLVYKLKKVIEIITKENFELKRINRNLMDRK